MNIVLGITEGSWISIGFGIITIAGSVMAFFLRYKAKADKADIKGEIMNDVETKLHDEIEPIQKRMEKHDADFKEFKRDEINPMKEKVNSLVTSTSVIESKLDTMIDMQSEFQTDIKKLIGNIFDKLDTKQDKK